MQTSEFYDKWSLEQMRDSDRARILKWKAVNLANLFLRSVKNHPISICEIGGAEGTVLDTVGRILGADELTNYDVSQYFSQHGAQMYPHIAFVHQEFSAQKEKIYDVIICSDIIEHVQQEDVFLHAVSQSCHYALFKIPLEKCLINTSPWYWLHGRLKPKEHYFGLNHYNGHLRGYTIGQAIDAVNQDFSLLDMQIAHVSYFYGGAKQKRLVRYLGAYLATWLFGGAAFILGASRSIPSEEN